jgi:hypothetical protein
MNLHKVGVNDGIQVEVNKIGNLFLSTMLVANKSRVDLGSIHLFFFFIPSSRQIAIAKTIFILIMRHKKLMFRYQRVRFVFSHGKYEITKKSTKKK